MPGSWKSDFDPGGKSPRPSLLMLTMEIFLKMSMMLMLTMEIFLKMPTIRSALMLMALVTLEEERTGLG